MPKILLLHTIIHYYFKKYWALETRLVDAKRIQIFIQEQKNKFIGHLPFF